MKKEEKNEEREKEEEEAKAAEEGRGSLRRETEGGKEGGRRAVGPTLRFISEQRSKYMSGNITFPLEPPKSKWLAEYRSPSCAMMAHQLF